MSQQICFRGTPARRDLPRGTAQLVAAPVVGRWSAHRQACGALSVWKLPLAKSNGCRLPIRGPGPLRSWTPA